MEETLALIPFLLFWLIFFFFSLPSLLLQVLPASFPGISPFPPPNPASPSFPSPWHLLYPFCLASPTPSPAGSLPTDPTLFLLTSLSYLCLLCLTSSFPLQN